MSRTTLDIDPSVLRALRARGRSEGKSMGQLASELMASELAREPEPEPPAFVWHSADLGEARVDLEDKDAVWALLDADS